MSQDDRDLQAVKDRFDTLAPVYDEKLKRARYYAGDLLLDAFLRHRPQQVAEGLEVLDLGCGTGICGKAFRPFASRLDGVDLSDKMLQKARELEVYNRLFRGDIGDHLRGNTERYHLITIASVFLYFPRLEETLEACRSTLHPGGMLIFTVDRHPEPGPDVAPSPRGRLMYTHGRDYVQRCLTRAQLTLLALEEVEERLAWKDLSPVPALLVVCVRDG